MMNTHDDTTHDELLTATLKYCSRVFLVSVLILTVVTTVTSRVHYGVLAFGLFGLPAILVKASSLSKVNNDETLAAIGDLLGVMFNIYYIPTLISLGISLILLVA